MSRCKLLISQKIAALVSIMELSDPARNAFCCVSLRTAIWTIVFLDVFYASATLTRIMTAYLGQDPSNVDHVSLYLYSAVFLVTITGALFGVVGLIKTAPTMISFYAISAILRIVLSLALTAYSLFNVDVLARQFVASLTDKLIAESASEPSEPVMLSRERLLVSAKGGLIGSMVFLELTSDIVLLYFAYITQSLSEWMKRGHSHPGDAAFHSGLGTSTPLLRTDV
jgi:hypothetical protein